MTPSRERLLGLLADGALHSGAKLAADLGMSRSAVWKLVTELRELGVDVDSLDRRGYRLPRPIELLDAATIRRIAAAEHWPLPAELEVRFAIDSTNESLYAAPAPAPGRPRLLFAELQRAGRGRRGRSWLAPFASGLTFSIGWTFAEMPAELSALSLAMGVQVARGLRRLGVPEARLKWPNDLVRGHRKLGGVLTQLRSEAGGPAYVVVGLGLNLDLPPAAREAIESRSGTAVADLRDALGGVVPARNRTAASVAAAMLEGLARFATDGFAPFAAEWRALDSLRDAPVRIEQSGASFEGIARGADAEGALLIERAGRLERIFSGDVSVRGAGAGS